MPAIRIAIPDLPTRLATGGFILHTGLEKWHGTEEQAQGVHRMAAGAFPFLGKVPPTTFLRALALAEMSIGAMLLTPVVPIRPPGRPRWPVPSMNDSGRSPAMEDNNGPQALDR